MLEKALKAGCGSELCAARAEFETAVGTAVDNPFGRMSWAVARTALDATFVEASAARFETALKTAWGKEEIASTTGTSDEASSMTC